MINDHDHRKPDDEELAAKVQFPFIKALSTSSIVIIYYLLRIYSYKKQGAIFDSENWITHIVCITIIASSFAYCYLGHFKSKKYANLILTIFVGILALGVTAFVFTIMLEHI